MSIFKKLFGGAKGTEASLPCPNCGGLVHETEGSPVSPYVNTYRCRKCGWSKLACGENCGSYLEYSAGTYKCQDCGWTGHGPTYKGDSDGKPQRGQEKPEPPPANCNRCGADIRAGDLIMKHSSSDLVVCEKCARGGGFGDGLERYK